MINTRKDMKAFWCSRVFLYFVDNVAALVVAVVGFIFHVALLPVLMRC